MFPIPSSSKVLSSNLNSLKPSPLFLAMGFCFCIGFFTLAKYFFPLVLKLFSIISAYFLTPIFFTFSSVTLIPAELYILPIECCSFVKAISYLNSATNKLACSLITSSCPNLAIFWAFLTCSVIFFETS